MTVALLSVLTELHDQCLTNVHFVAKCVDLILFFPQAEPKIP